MAVLADLAIKATALLIVAVISVGLMRRASAASRHLAWTAVFLAAALLPVARVALPAMTLFVLPTAADRNPGSEDPGLHFEGNLGSEDPGLQFEGNPGSGDPGLQAGTRPGGRPWSLSGTLVVLWVAGAIAILLKGVVGALRVRQLARHAQPANDARLLARVQQTAAAYRISRPLTVLISSSEWMPATWGILRPTILLPASATSWVDEHPDRLDAVLVHEMAHIARLDALSQVIVRLAIALFWFNPLVWLAARRARLERERACDDAVLARGLRPSAYAGDLLVLAQSLAPPALTSSAVLAMARRSQLDDRIRALLDERVNRCGVSQLSLIVASALVMLMLPVAATRLAARTNTDPAIDTLASDQNLPVASAIVPANADAVPARVGTQPIQTPQATPTPSPQVAPSTYAGVQLLDQQGKWRLERGEMARQLLQRARNYLHDSQVKVEIGTLAPVDTKAAEQMLAAVEQATTVASLRHGEPPFVLAGAPTDAQIATIRSRFAEASKNLDAALTRFDHGLATSAEVDATFKAAIAALTDPPAPPQPPGRVPRETDPAQVRFVSRSGMGTLEHSYNMTSPQREAFLSEAHLMTGRIQSGEDEFLKGTVPATTPGLMKPVARKHPMPKYTPDAMRQKIQGDVLVDVVVGTDGTVLRTRIAQSLDKVYGLDEEALKTAAQWTFDPGVLNGQKVTVAVQVVLTFRLH